MGSKTRLSSYCTKRGNNGVNLVTSRKINTRLARPMKPHQKSCIGYVYKSDRGYMINVNVSSRENVSFL